MSDKKRFVFSDVGEDLGLAALKSADWYTEGDEKADCFIYSTILLDTAHDPPRLVGMDGGEPEDATFGRDWSWVVDELNALAEETQA